MPSSEQLADVHKRELAVAALRGVDDGPRLAHAIRHLADAYRRAGRVEPAEKCYDEAISIYRAHPESRPLDVANALRGFAVLKSDAGEADAAEQLWTDVRARYESLGITSGVAESAARLARLAHQCGDVPRSREWIDSAIASAKAAGGGDVLEFVLEVAAEIAR
jgi:tetratricopeptide (TPR) repeat protein